MASVSDEQHLIDAQDLHDLAIVAERRDEGTISFEEMKQKLKQDGLRR